MINELTISGMSLSVASKGKLSDVFYTSNYREYMMLLSRGIPVIKTNLDNDEILKVMLRGVVKKHMPHVKLPSSATELKKQSVMFVPGGSCKIPEFDDGRGIEATSPGGVADVAVEERTFDGARPMTYKDRQKLLQQAESVSLEDYCKDLEFEVVLSELQRLRLLPSFIGNIVDCIRDNMRTTEWTEGYNKKLGVPLGNFRGSKERRNLIILDVSASIPEGISATMISLIDSLRGMTRADLIITGRNSGWYSHYDVLPKPSEIRLLYGKGNESDEFYAILKEHVAGKQWGNVISFGDNDTPNLGDSINWTGTSIGQVWNFHTWRERTWTGYAKWCKYFVKCEREPVFNTDWTTMVKGR